MDLHELFIENLQELAGMEKLLAAGLAGLAQASSNTELQAALSEFVKQSGKQVGRIEQANISLRLEHEAGACPPMAAMITEAAKSVESASLGVIRDVALLGAANRIKHFEIAAYSSTISIAKTLGYGDAANLLVQNLQEELKAVDHLKKLSNILLKRAQDEVFP